ncbi:Restriction endonuclease S subunit (HsdS) [Fructobacillus tropaeoli]|nr:Restriction endonuclease S subunit (HsdS) [Fructobacillus tropaeoli]
MEGFSDKTFGGGTPKTSNPQFWNGSIPWIQSSDLKVDKVQAVSAKKHITEKGLESSATKLIPKNSIAIVTRVGVGKLSVMPYEYATSQDFLSLSYLNVEINFAIYAIYRKLMQEAHSVQGTSIKGITKSELLSKKIATPSESKEQEKIGSLFERLDNLITLHQRKLNLLQEQKKSLLQKMFPKKDEKIPEIRFNGFTDDWEQRKLGEVANIIGGGTPSTTEGSYWNGDIDWYAPSEIGDSIYVSHSKRSITKLGLSKSSARLLPIGTILFTSRAGIGNTAILRKSATTNQGFQSIVPDETKLDTYFIFSLSKLLKKYGEKMGAGSTFLEVSGKTMSKMPILLPEIDEQRTIGKVFERLDNLITLHQRKLDALQEQKKGLLQKMFV